MALTDRQLFLIILGAHVLLALLLFDPKLATAGDNAWYIILAKSILQGRYHNLYDPTEPAHTLYPPGFAALIAPAVAIAGASFIPMKLIVLLCSIGAVALFYLMLKRIMPGRTWLAPLLMFAACPLLLEYSHEVFSEVPFVLFTVLGLFLFQRALASERNQVRNFLLAGAAVGAAYYIRSQGLFLIAAVGLVLLVGRRWKALAVTAAAIALIALPWFVRTQLVPHGGYLPWLLTKDPYNLAAGKLTLGDMTGRFLANIQLYVFRVYPLIVLPVFGARANSILLGFVGVAATAVTVVGLFRRLVLTKAGAMELYTVFTLGVVLFWPAVWSGDRFLLPILPFLLYYLYVGLETLSARLRTRYLAQSVCAFVVLLACVTNVGRASTNLTDLGGYVKGDRFSGYDEGWRAYFEATLWLRDHTEPNAVVVTRKPQFTYLYSGRHSFVYPYIADENRVLAAIDSLGANYAFLESFFAQSIKYFYPVIKNHPERFEQVATIGPAQTPVYIFRVKR
jgi:4-amino-4-deoxy-L-arabinose transferase-like glycosyltransferase